MKILIKYVNTYYRWRKNSFDRNSTNFLISKLTTSIIFVPHVKPFPVLMTFNNFVVLSPFKWKTKSCNNYAASGGSKELMSMNGRIKFLNGPWLWLSWESGRFWHLRYAVRIPLSAKKNIEHLFTVNCIEKTKISSLCSNNFHKIKTPYLGGIRTGIVEVEGKHIDHRGPFKYILLSSFEQND